MVAVRAEAPALGATSTTSTTSPSASSEPTEADLTRIVDERWDPPVSLGVRLVSVVTDDLQHVGQAAYVRGLTEKEQS